MGLYTIGLSDQQQGAATGKQFYPSLGANIQNLIIGDEFQRSSLTPTGAYTLYTTASNDSNGTFAISNNQQGLLTTDSSAGGDDVDVRVTGYTFNRTADSTSTDNRSSIEYDIIFSLSSAADVEGFVGIHIQGTTLAALPTTARHMGVFFDKSAQANFLLTSGNASAQATTDTGEALSTDVYRVNIAWNGSNTGVIKLFNVDNNDSTEISSQTVTTLGGTTYEVHFFVQTETTAAKTLGIKEWRAKIL